MMLKTLITKLQKFAVEKGATSTKLIAVKDIFVEDWVRQKCEFGCDLYAKRFSCPPYSPNPEETRKLLQDYKLGLLVEFTNLKDGENGKVHKIMFGLEQDAFLNGMHKAFAYNAGPCDLCDCCLAEKIEKPGEYSQRECKNPLEARPSMEACGINVYKTARGAGYKIDVVKSKTDYYKCFGLLLLE